MRLAILPLVLVGCYFDEGGVAGGDDAPGGADAPHGDGPRTVDGAPGPDGPPPDASVTTPACPAGYVATGDPTLPHGYRFDDVSRSRTAAIADCAADSAGLTHLAVIDSAAENAWLDTLSASRSIWLGMSDAASEGTWVTVLGTPQTFFHWASGQPDNFFNEDYAVLLDGGRWNDVNGGGNQRYVCECDPSAGPP